jgi:urease accessory protein
MRSGGRDHVIAVRLPKDRDMLDLTAARSGDAARVDHFPSTRAVEAMLRFALGGGRTVLTHQRAPYPLHLTRPFHLDAARPDLATVYLQSASGGLYRDDGIDLAIEVAQGAAAQVTTQACTIVHDTRGLGARHSTRIAVGRGAFAAVTPDPLVLFPGAAISTSTEITIHPEAHLIVTESLFHHDPAAQGRSFDRFAAAIVVRNPEGVVLMADRGAIDGAAFLGNASPLGRFRAAGTMLLCGPRADRLDPFRAEAGLRAVGCIAGATAAPNGAGVAIRLLAVDGGALSRGLDAAFALAFEAALGVPPARRRK